MRFLKGISLVSGVGALALSAVLVQAGAAQDANSSVQTQQPRTTARAFTQRRSYRSYSYEPSRGGDIAARASTPTWTRADSKVKFRYGVYPY